MKDVLSSLSKLRINDEVEVSVLRLGSRRKTSLRLMEAPVQMIRRR